MRLQVYLRQALLLLLQFQIRPLLQSTPGYLDTGLPLQAMSEAVVPVPEVKLLVDQTLASRTISEVKRDMYCLKTCNEAGKKR